MLMSSHSAISTDFVNTARDGVLITSLGTFFQCLTSFSEKMIFLISNKNYLWHSIKTFYLVLSLYAWEKKPTPSSLKPPFRQL